MLQDVIQHHFHYHTLDMVCISILGLYARPQKQIQNHFARSTPVSSNNSP